MPEWVHEFIDGPYAPHGFCLLWQPALIWTHVVSDALIAAAYFSIPIALVRFLRRRPDVEFGAMIWLFAVFIMACGSTHLLAIWNLWHGAYGLEGVVKAITAAASVPTAIMLWPLIPRALAIPSPTMLQRANEELAGTIGQRDAALAQLTAEIVQRQRAEEALVQSQKIEAVGQLTGGIAHDFNNLLQAVGGNLDLISRSPERADKVAQWARNALKGVERGTRLTSQLLAFSRTQRLELKELDANKVMEGMAELIQRSIGPAIELRTALAEEDCTVQADQTQLELAMLNLAINARDAMPEGGKLIISTRAVHLDHVEQGAEPGDYVAIEVSDTGEGMPPEVASRAFEPFFTTKGVGRGTGLGLSMAFGMARQSGGTVLLRSEVGAGTTVTILLRHVADPLRTPAPRSEPDNPRPARKRELKVMIIDDDDGVRGVIEDTLQTLGYICRSFSGGSAGLAALDEVAPDLLVLDFAMPDMNGADVARQVRRTHPDLPIIFVSGFADSAALDAVVDAHATILRKPFRTDDLLARFEALQQA